MPDSPLTDRVSGPATLTPAAVDGITWRPVVLDDVEALGEASRLIAEADHPDWTDTSEDLLDELGLSYTDLVEDSLLAVTDAGDVVAWGLVVMPSHYDTLIRVMLLGGVVPAHRGRGIGRALLTWQQGRALQRLASATSTLPGWIVVSADERAPASARLLERSGFAPTRWFQHLVRTVEAPLSAVPTPDGMRIVSYSPEHSAAAHRVRDDAFRGEGSSQPMSDEQWESMTTLSTFAHELSFVAVDATDRVVALLLTLVTDDDPSEPDKPVGYVWVLGVAPDHRRHGIARSLLAHHLSALHEAGLRRSALDVATDGPDQGVELFTRLGYEKQTTSVNHVRVY